MSKERKEDVRDKLVKANVIIPGNFENLPEQHEIDAAWILAYHFNCKIEFMETVKRMIFIDKSKNVLEIC
jgi:hypothetical protein